MKLRLLLEPLSFRHAKPGSSAKCRTLSTDIAHEMREKGGQSFKTQGNEKTISRHRSTKRKQVERQVSEKRNSDSLVYDNLLRKCDKLSEGKRIHAHVIGNGINGDRVLTTLIIVMYGKSKTPNDALLLFNRTDNHSVVSWTALVAAYAQNGYMMEALNILRQMQDGRTKPNRVTFVILVNLCTSPAALAEGKLIHSHVVSSPLCNDIFLLNSLIHMYGKCGNPSHGMATFGRMEVRNLISWNVMIGAYAQHGCCNEALDLFWQIQGTSLQPDEITFTSILNVCVNEQAFPEGKLIHAWIVGRQLESSIIVGNALLKMYCKCGGLIDAKNLFNRLPEPDIVSWTSMILGSTDYGDHKEALRCFRAMRLGGVRPDHFSYATILNACSSSIYFAEGKLVHSCVLESALDSDIVVGTALFNMYRKCSNVEDAWRMFEKIAERDLVSWNAMITGYAQQGFSKEALDTFQQMIEKSVKPNKVTFLSILEACTNMGLLTEARLAHVHIVDSGLEFEIMIATGMINMYAKCGNLMDARRMFDKLSVRNLECWTAMIAAYGQHGHVMETLEVFCQMQQAGIKPNEITLLSVLSACGHAGLVKEGFHYFVSLTEQYSTTPILEHYRCTVDLLGRAAKLDEAEDFINKMPIQPDILVWKTLLGACTNHNDPDRGKRASEHVFELNPQEAASYVLLSNIYATAGRWADVARLRKEMRDRGIVKLPGRSSIEVNGKMHYFYANDTSHPQKDKIYAELKKIYKDIEIAGHIPITNLVLHDVAEERKKQLLCYHSEKLAITFGLMNTPPGTPLRILKNLRVCADCHAVLKIISYIADRVITVRDSMRFHHFHNGECSCGDYW